MGLLNKEFGYKNLVIIGDGSTDAEACPPAVSFIHIYDIYIQTHALGTFIIWGVVVLSNSIKKM